MLKQNHYKRDIDLREILAILRKQYKIILIMTLSAFVLSYLANNYVLKSVYTTKAVLMVNQAVPEGTAPNRTEPASPGLQGIVNKLSVLPELTINTYIGQLTSNTLLERVLIKLKLDQQGYSTNSLAGVISVTPVKDTNLINVNVTNTDPYMAAKIANTLTNEFLDFTTKANEQQMGKTLEFLNKQVKTTEKDLAEAIANLKQLEMESGGTEVLGQLIKTKSEEFSKYQSQRMLVNVEYNRLLAGQQEIEKELLKTAPTIKVTNGLGDEQPNPAYLNLKNLSYQRKVSIVEKKSEIGSYNSLVSGLESDLSKLQLQLADRKNKIMLGQKEVERLEQTTTQLKNNITEAQIAKSIRLGETGLSVVSMASIPEYPFKPNKKLNMVVAVTLGLTIGIFLAFVLNFLKNTLNTSTDIEEFLGLPVLGHVPKYKPYNGRPTSTNSAKTINQQLRM